MTVNDAIRELQALSDAGYGNAILRNYSELSDETYPPAKFVLRKSSDNANYYDESYGDWVEVA